MNFPSTQGAPFSAESGLADRAAQVATEGPKERKRGKKRNEKSVAQVFCVTKGGLGVPRPSSGGVLSTRRGRLEEGWGLADGFGLGRPRKAGNEVAGWRSYLIFWAHFMSSARGFSPVRPWIRSSRRLQKPIFSRG